MYSLFSVLIVPSGIETQMAVRTRLMLYIVLIVPSGIETSPFLFAPHSQRCINCT